MVWPTPQDYNEAVQQPQVCFLDPDLRKSRVELNHLGLPRPMTGAFASVYRLSNISGTSWAVRCFLEHRDDMKERYAVIAKTIGESQSSLFAKFEYLERGIKVRADWYPVLKMEWVDGDSIDKYLDRHVKTRVKVANLHKQFREMVAQLKKIGIAHGDLQHGNILVTEAGLRLIDYDDMFVDGLRGKSSHELGHRNFQHPDRHHNHFASDLDNFSTWVIDLCLKALVVEPDLWRDFNGGDDCLLLRHSDFKEADESAILKAMIDHDETDLSESAQLFREMLKLKPSRVPEYNSDSRIIAHLLHEASVEAISQRDREEYGESTPDGSAAVLPDMDSAASFKDYDEWLASVEQKKLTGKKAMKAADQFTSGISTLGRKAWKIMLSNVAPAALARSVVDEANYQYDDCNYTEAVKLYTEAAELLKAHENGEWKGKALSSTVAPLLGEVLVRLGYCHVLKEQLGTARHHFKGANDVATHLDNNKHFDLGELRLQASLLLAATFFELGDARAFKELKAYGSAKLLLGTIRKEKEGPFNSRLTLSSMMAELGHDYLAEDNFSEAYSAYEAAMEACQWISEERQADAADGIIARAACGFCAAKIAEKETDEAIRIFCEEIDVPSDVAQLKSLIRTELKGKLRSDWKFAELMRVVGHHLQARGMKEQANLAYTAALTVLRVCDGSNKLQMKMADCLLGLGKSVEAIAVIRDSTEWTKGLSQDLSSHVETIDDFGHALTVSTVVFDDDTHRHRYQCLDALVKKCPGPEMLDRTITSLEGTDVGGRVSFAELMFELARDLTKEGRNKVAKLAYAASFKAFKRTNADDRYGSTLMECLLAMGDLEVAANLLIDGGRLEEMVRLMVNVMISQRNYDRTAICDLLVKVAETQMSRPPASVTEEEISQTIDLLQWCAGDENSDAIVAVKARAAQWMQHRELAFAHSLVDQGNFESAQKVFERIEGPSGPNVILVQELSILKHLSAALIDRDRGYVMVADGLTFGSAVHMLCQMRDKKTLSPSFALKVAELIRSNSIIGAQRYVAEVYALLCECGRGFEHAALCLRDCLRPDVRDRIESQLNIKGNESVHISISDGNFELAIQAPEPTDKSFALPPELANESWRRLHRTFYLIDSDDYGSAIVELNKLMEPTVDQEFLSDCLILRGYCSFLGQDEDMAELAFKQALRAAGDPDCFRYKKAALCIAMVYHRSREKQRFMRQLVDPTLSQKNLLKIATQLIGSNLNENDNIADLLANDLLARAEKGEKSTLISGRIYLAALTIFGIRNERRRLQVINCLDAVGRHNAAAIVLKQYVDAKGQDEDVAALVEKLARRHIKNPKIERITELYEQSGVNFRKQFEVAQVEHIVGTISRVILGQVPRRLFVEARLDLTLLYGQNRLTTDVCDRICKAIVDGVEGDTTGERRDRFRNDLLSISRVIEKVYPACAYDIRKVLEHATISGSKQDPMETELFDLVAEQ